MNSIYDISLDLHKMSAPISLSVKQGDTGREIHISLTDGSTPYKIPDGSYAVFAGTKPDNKVLWNSCTIKGDTIIYELTAQTVAVVGWIPVQIRLYGAGGKLLQSPDFVLIVDAPAVEDNTVVTVSDNEVTALTQLVTECTALKADLDKSKTGGYYVPVVDQPTENTLQFSWMASGEGLPAVPPAVVELPGGSNDSTQNGNGLTTAQIEALDGMFKVCAFTKEDVSAEYAAFCTAFGIEGGDIPNTPDEPDEPVTPEVTLTSISVVYSGGEVAVGTAVTALTGVVVTAHYSDGSTTTVTDYTLSGEIAEGSNTVTVSYQGKTTTFMVTGVAESGGDDTAGTDWEDGVPYVLTFTENRFMNGANAQNFDGYAVTDYLPCKGASSVSFASGIQGVYDYCSSFDAEKKFIAKFFVNVNTNWEYVVPEDVAYIRITKTMTASDPVVTPHA